MKYFKIAMFVSFIAAATSTMVGCAGNKVREVETKLELTQTVTDGSTIGVNEKEVAVIQKKVMASDELNKLIWQNNGNEWKLGHLANEIKNCREDLADERLGGNGAVQALPEMATKTPSEMKEEFGIVNGSLQFVTTEDLQKRVQAERSYNASLEKTIKVVEDLREDCERKLRIARRKAGLPSERTIGVVQYDSEGRVVKTIKKGETSLDDAFEIKKAKEAEVAQGGKDE